MEEEAIEVIHFYKKEKLSIKDRIFFVTSVLFLITFVLSSLTVLSIALFDKNEKGNLHFLKVVASYNNGTYNIVTKAENGFIKDFEVSEEEYNLYKPGTYYCCNISYNEINMKFFGGKRAAIICMLTLFLMLLEIIIMLTSK